MQIKEFTRKEVIINTCNFSSRQVFGSLYVLSIPSDHSSAFFFFSALRRTPLEPSCCFFLPSFCSFILLDLCFLARVCYIRLNCKPELSCEKCVCVQGKCASAYGAELRSVFLLHSAVLTPRLARP